MFQTVYIWAYKPVTKKNMDEHLRFLRHANVVYTDILEAMEKRRLYLDPQLNLQKLAYLLGTNRTQLSYTINGNTGMNFSTWLSNFRVNYLKEELLKHPEKNPLELFKKAGFTSRTSFYRQFRLITGMTPKEFQIKAKE